MGEKTTYHLNSLKNRHLLLLFIFLSLLSYGQLTVGESTLFSNKGLFSVGEDEIIIETQTFYDEGHWLLTGAETQNFSLEDVVLNKLTVVNKQGVQFKGILAIEERLDVEQGDFVVNGELKLSALNTLLEQKGELVVTKKGVLFIDSNKTLKISLSRNILTEYTITLYFCGQIEECLYKQKLHLKEITTLDLHFLIMIKQVEIPPPEFSFV